MGVGPFSTNPRIDPVKGKVRPNEELTGLSGSHRVFDFIKRKFMKNYFKFGPMAQQKMSFKEKIHR